MVWSIGFQEGARSLHPGVLNPEILHLGVLHPEVLHLGAYVQGSYI